ncbi:unnamed protein product [Schistosoma turkestanicum]|nr:unnamed protein product [Schistosoma turkestanicum]
MLRLLTLRSLPKRLVTNIRNYNPDASYKNEHGSSYYLIPEIPSESYLSKSILEPLNISNLEDLKPDKVFGGVSRLIMNYQVSLSKLSDSIQKGEISKNDITIISSLEQASFPVEQAFRNLNCLTTVKNDHIWNLIVSRLYQKFKAARREYFHRDSTICEALLTLRQSSSKLDEYEKGLLDVWIYDCWLMGTGLLVAGNKYGKIISFSELNELIQGINNSQTTSQITSPNARKSLSVIHDNYADVEKEECQFQTMVASSAAISLPQYYSSKYTGRPNIPSNLEILTGATDIKVAESDLAPSAPYWLPAVLGGKEDGGHIAGMHVSLVSNALVSEFLKHCSNNELRKTVWEYWVRRASGYYFGPSTGLYASNDQRINDIRRLRKNLAKYLNCKDWLSVLWSSPYSHTPSSPDQLVNDVLEPFRISLKQIGECDLKMLKEWANVNLHLYGKTLEPWDVDYALEQYNYAVNYKHFENIIIPPDGSLINYLHTVFSELANLFHFKLTPQIPRSTSKDDTDNDVDCYVVEKLVYHVEDLTDGTVFGEIIIDPFARSNRTVPVGGNLFVPVVTRNNLSNNDIRVHSGFSNYPVAYILGSLNQSTETLGISFNVLLSYMSVFGTCLQYITCRVPHHELYSSPHYIALDTRHIMSDLCYTIGCNYAIPCLKNYFTNKQLQQQQHQSSFQPSAIGLKTPSKPITSLYFLQDLYESRFDLAIWSKSYSEAKWSTIQKNLWKLHMPYPLHSHDYLPCSYTHIFGPNSEAGLIYHRIWRKVLLDDILLSFKEVGWLSSSSSDKTDCEKVSEVFKRFRDTYLTYGSAIPPAELFRRFRGRDIDPQICLKKMERLVEFPELSLPSENVAPLLVRS